MRAFLHVYGPASPGELASWIGIAAAEARRWWPREGLSEVRLGRARRWIAAEDLAALRSPPPPPELLLLAPSDPFLASPNRALLAPDPTVHRRLWRAVGTPGVVLWRGRPVATWRQRLRGTHLQLSVEPVQRLDAVIRGLIEAQAARVGAVRGADNVTVQMT